MALNLWLIVALFGVIALAGFQFFGRKKQKAVYMGCFLSQTQAETLFSAKTTLWVGNNYSIRWPASWHFIGDEGANGPQMAFQPAYWRCEQWGFGPQQLLWGHFKTANDESVWVFKLALTHLNQGKLSAIGDWFLQLSKQWQPARQWVVWGDFSPENRELQQYLMLLGLENTALYTDQHSHLPGCYQRGFVGFDFRQDVGHALSVVNAVIRF